MYIVHIDYNVGLEHYHHYDSVQGAQKKIGFAKCHQTHLYRYNVNGFVEELLQLPENRRDHACAALPATGVRPDQPTC